MIFATYAPAAAVLVVTALRRLTRPRAASTDGASGDSALADELVRALGRTRIGAASIALLDGDDVTYAGLGGASEHTPFEIGSVAKAMTGMLLADAAARGEVSLHDAAGDVVTSLGPATLAELATHHSGLPRLPAGPLRRARSVAAALTAGNPYAGSTPERVLAWARRADAPGHAAFAYSNLGAATLGQALAVRAATPYPDLLRDRILLPLDMRETTVATSAAAVPPGHATGTAAGGGLAPAPWTGAGFAPAGVGVWSTSSDLARLITGAMGGRAPGASATTPVADAGGGTRIGLGWFTMTVGGHTVTWHNGGTGGFRSFVGYDAAAGRGVVLLAATDQDVDAVALNLLMVALG